MLVQFFFLLWCYMQLCLRVTFSFDRVELVSDITKTVLLTADIGTKLNSTVDT